MLIEIKYEPGDFVYLITDEEQARRIITRIIIAPSGIIYEVACGTKSSEHYDFEISTEPNLIEE